MKTSNFSSLLSSWMPQVPFNSDHGGSDQWPLLKSSEEISLTVAATSQLSAPAVVSQSYSWVTPDTRPTSPPAQYNPHLHQHQINTACVNICGSSGLGLMIRGGAEYGLGIFITGVDPNSAAEKSGLQVGDQILEVNGENFLSVTYDTAVSVLKYSRLLNMTLRRVAKVPHSCTTYHRRRKSSKSRRPSAEYQLSENLEATLVMIEEKSKSVLSPGSHSLLQETISEYAAGKTPVSRLLSVAAQVLNLPDKLSLLTEIREIIRPGDLGQFDSTVFNQSSALSIDREDMYGVDSSGDVITPSEFEEINKLIRSFHLSNEDSLDDNESTYQDKRLERMERNFPEFVKSPSEDSGVDSNNERIIRRRKKISQQQKERKRNKITKENESPLLGNFDDDGISLLQTKNEKIKTNYKPRKTTRKKYQEKSLRKNEHFLDNFQNQRASPPLCISPLEEFDVGCDPPIYFEPSFLEEISLPPYSRPHSLSETCLQSAHFTHSTQTITPSYSQRFHLDLPASQPTHINSSILMSHSPIFVPARPEGSSHSPLYGIQTSNISQRHGLEPSSNPLCSAPLEPGRGCMEFKISRPYEDFPCPIDVRDQISYGDQRSHKRSPRVSSDSQQHQPQQQQKKQKSKNRIPNEQMNMPPLPPQERGLHVHPIRPERGRRSEFGNNLEVQNGETRIDPSGSLRSPTHRQVSQNGHKQQNHSTNVSQSSSAHTCPGRSGKKSSAVISDNRGRFHVVVKKTRANLGIAIEGGSDTKHPLPRVINIASTGAAFEAGGLRVGQLIIGVNGKRLEGKTHEEAARLIADSWTDRSRQEVELLVVDRKPCEADLRRNSISLLSQSS